MLGANLKVSALAQMVPLARSEYLVVNDSDIRVEKDYLQCVIRPLLDPRAGMVTCLYRGIAANSLGSKLESLGISTDFAPGVLAAWLLENGIRFGLGSTLALRKQELQAIGGFEAFADYLADDYELGRRIAAAGFEVRLSEVVVETFLPAYKFADFFRHQVRWARSIRDSRPWGFAGMVVTFGVAWGLLALAATRNVWGWMVLALLLCLRAVVAWAVGDRILRDRQFYKYLVLLPLRDLMAVLVWAASFLGHSIHWRGESFTLKDGRLLRHQ
jgi:ceramide glucosyltransferase